jgi:WD40 repeat protein
MKQPIGKFLIVALTAVVFALANWTLAQEKPRGPIAIAKLDRATPVDFEKEILPLLKNNCLACHNKTKAKADLILETPADILKGGETGPGVVPGHSGESLLLEAAAHQKDLVMPPRDNKVAAADLTPEQLALLKLWIDQGAVGEVHGGGPIAWQPLPAGLNPIYAAVLTPDGQFAICGRANQIFVYHIPSNQFVTRLTDPQLFKEGIYGKPGVAHRDMIGALAVSPDGTLVASGGYREIKLWRRPRNVQAFALAAAGRDGVRCVAASNDGRWIATGGADGSARIWDGSSGKMLAELTGHTAAVNAVRFSLDGTKIATGSADKTIRIWEAPSGKILALAKCASEVKAVTWIAKGTQLASGGGDNVIRIWKMPESAGGPLVAVKELKGHEGPITALDTISAADGRIISGSADGSVRVWNVESGQVVQQMKHGAAVTAVAVRPDGKRFASAGVDNVARLWDASNAKQIAEMKGDRYAQELAAERERALAFAVSEVSYRKKTLQAEEKQQQSQVDRVKKGVDAAAAAEKPLAEKQKAVATATQTKADIEKAIAALKADSPAVVEKKKELEPAGKALAAAQAELKKVEQTKSNADNELLLAIKAAQQAADATAGAQSAVDNAEADQKKRDADVPAARKAVGETEKPIRAVAFSPDNLTLATGGDDLRVHTWSAETGEAFETFKGHQGAVFGLAFASSGRLVSGAADQSAIAWDLQAGWTLERVIGSGDAVSPLADRVYALAFSPDGQKLASGGGVPSRSGEIKIWQVATGKLLQDLENVHSDTVFGLDFSPEGKYLASSAADRFVRVVDLSAGRVVKSFEGHAHHVLGVRWKRDGRTLVSAGADNVVKVWDFVTGERKKNIEGFSKEVTSISFVGYTDQALAASGDGKVRLVTDAATDVRAFAGATDFVNAAAVTPDGKIVIAGGQDSVLRVWNGANAQVIAAFAAPVAK